MIVLEEEIQHQQQSYNNLVKEQERLLKDKAEQDKRLQREIRDRLCLKMVRNADPLAYTCFVGLAVVQFSFADIFINFFYY